MNIKKKKHWKWAVKELTLDPQIKLVFDANGNFESVTRGSTCHNWADVICPTEMNGIPYEPLTKKEAMSEMKRVKKNLRINSQ